MPKKPTPAQRTALIDYYIEQYEAENGKRPVVNRNKANFTADALLRDYGKEEAQNILDYFIAHYERDFEWFNYNYEKVVVAKAEYDRERELIAQRRAETQRRLEEWRKRKEDWTQKKS